MTLATERQHIASLAHATAHEVTALREAKRRVEEGVVGDAPTKAHVAALLADMIASRERKVVLMAAEVAGHA